MLNFILYIKLVDRIKRIYFNLAHACSMALQRKSTRFEWTWPIFL